MAKDVEALFKNINQAGLPYKVFEADETLNDILEAVDAIQPPARTYGKPQLVETPPSEPEIPELTQSVEAAAQPAPSGFLRNYAPAQSELAAADQPILLKDLFNRMGAKS